MTTLDHHHESTTSADSADRPTMSVVVTTYNRRHLLEHHLPVLLDDPATHELIVVDDGSSDGTDQLLAQLADTHPALVPLRLRNGGPERARRAGVQAASGRIVLLMDDDVEPTPDLVSAHREHHAGPADRDRVVVGYMPIELSDADDTATVAYARDYELVMQRYEADPGRVLFDLWAGHVSLPRAACLDVADGEPTWPQSAFFEDRHLGLQLQRAGLVGVFDRDLTARHRHAGSLDRFRRAARAMGYGDRVLHERHDDLLGAYDRRTAGIDDLPAPMRALARLGDLPGATVLTRCLLTVARTSQRLGLRRTTDIVSKVMRRLEFRIGGATRGRDLRSEHAAASESSDDRSGTEVLDHAS